MQTFTSFALKIRKRLKEKRRIKRLQHIRSRKRLQYMRKIIRINKRLAKREEKEKN